MIENTTNRDPWVHVLGSMADGPSGYIEGMERDGQQQLVESTAFPSDAPIADLEALGFVFGPVDDRDPMFRPATLPDGWTQHGSDHAMHSEIRDEKGRARVRIFYKAAFYDRSARAHLIGPHMPLINAIWDDEEPTEVVLDDLLSAEFARKYLADRLAEDLRYVELIRDSGRDATAREAKVARIRHLQALVEKAAGGGS